MNLMNNHDFSSYCEQNYCVHMLEQNFQEKCNIEYFSSRKSKISLNSMENFGNTLVEIYLGNTLNINNNLEEFQKKQLIKMLQKNSSAFA